MKNEAEPNTNSDPEEVPETPTITQEELAAKYPPLEKPQTVSTREIVAWPITAKRSVCSGVMYSRLHKKLRFWVRGTGIIQYRNVPEEYFIENVSHGATVDEKIPLYFEGRFLKDVLSIEDVSNWEK